MNQNFNLKDLSGKLIHLASRINLMLYYEQVPPDDTELRSYLRELSIVTAIMESQIDKLTGEAVD